MYYVYHISNQSTKDLTDGYIGITGRPLEVRFKEHSKADSKVGSKIRELNLTSEDIYLVFKGSKNECKKVEYALRPKKFMGWNIEPGGGTTVADGYRKKSMDNREENLGEHKFIHCNWELVHCKKNKKGKVIKKGRIWKNTSLEDVLIKEDIGGFVDGIQVCEYFPGYHTRRLVYRWLVSNKKT